MYRTKTQKKNAIIAIETKARKLYLSGVLTTKDIDTITLMVIRANKKL